MTRQGPFAAPRLSPKQPDGAASINLRRVRLPYRAAGASPGSVTLLRAPIGFGKTTLLKQWLAEAKTQRERTSWITLTAIDRSIVGLASTLGRAGAPLRVDIERPLSAYTVEQALTGHDAAGRSFFVDDWDAIRDSESENLIATIVVSAHLRANLFIAARRPCGLPLDALLADDRLRVIGQNALKFSESEQRRLLGPAMWHNISTELLDACDGWPLALKLVRTVERGPDADLQAPSVFAHDSGLEAMVTRQVEQACTDQEIELLDILGLNPDFDVAILNEVRGASDSGELLDGIASLLPFNLRADKDGLRYRPSTLIRPIFRRRFDALGPTQQRIIATKAFDKAVGHGRTLDAINYALLAGDAEKAIGLLESVGPLRLMMIYGVEPVEDILRRLPLQSLANAFRSKLAVSITHAKRGCLVEAREMVDAAIVDIKASSLGEGARRVALRDAVFVKMQISACSDSAWADDYEHAARAELAKEPAFAAWSRVCSGIVKHQIGNLDEADADFDEAQVSCEQVGADYQLLHLKLHRAHVALARGNLRAATRALREIKASARASYSSDIGFLAIAEIGRLEASLIASRPSVQAEAIADALADLRHGDAWYEPFASAFVSMARCLWRNQGVDAVLRGLNEIEEDVSHRGITHVSRILQTLRAFYLALDGQFAAADLLLQAAEQPEPQVDGSPVFWRERHLRGLAASMLAASRNQTAEAIRIADCLIEESRRDGRKLALIEAHLNRVRILNSAPSRKAEAVASLTRGVELANDLGAYGLLDEWRDLIDEHAAAIEEHLRPKTCEMLVRVREEWQGRIHRDLLSNKEISVLKGVATGLTNKQIGRELDVSADTIKFHLKQCFRKLHAGNRADAVQSARTARLI